jgi:hypothetical protein
MSAYSLEYFEVFSLICLGMHNENSNDGSQVQIEGQINERDVIKSFCHIHIMMVECILNTSTSTITLSTKRQFVSTRAEEKFHHSVRR